MNKNREEDGVSEEVSREPLDELIERAMVLSNSLILASSTVSEFSQLLNDDPLKDEPASDLKLSQTNSRANGLSKDEESTFCVDDLDDLLLSAESEYFCDDSSSELKYFELAFAEEEDEEHARDVAEEALLKELFFPGLQEGEHCELDKLLVSSISCHEKEEARAAFLPRNGLCLSVSVGRMVLSEPILKYCAEGGPSIWSTQSQLLSTCTCLLSLSFPAVIHLPDRTILCPEQSISISPLKVGKRELIFEHTTQLSWHLPTVQLLNIWKSQAAKVTVLMRWQTGEVMEIYGCICLEDIFDAMPSTSQTHLVLVGAKASSKNVGAEGNSDSQKASKADLTNDKKSMIALECFRGEVNRHDVKKLKVSIRGNTEIQIEDRPMATLEISLQVLQQKPVTVSSGSHHWPVNETVKETKGTTSLHATGDARSPIPPICSTINNKNDLWLYVNFHGLQSYLSKVDMAFDMRPSQSLLMVVKSGSYSAYRFIGPFQHAKAWKYKYRKLPDVMVQAPPPLEKPLLFCEIWLNYESYQLLADGLEGLIGLIRIPYVLNSHRQDQTDCQAVSVTDICATWDHSKIFSGKKVNVLLATGLKREIINLQRENHAAAILQWHLRRLCEARQLKVNKRSCINLQRVKEVEGSSQVKTLVPFEMIRMLGQEANTIRHVFEVRVLRVVGLPAQNPFNNQKFCSGGVFIKYMFSGEDEPLYTQDVSWQRVMYFGASVEHRIMLPSDHNWKEHLQSSHAGKHGLEFQAWVSSERQFERSADFSEPVKVPRALNSKKWCNQTCQLGQGLRKLSLKPEKANSEEYQDMHWGTAVLSPEVLVEFLQRRKSCFVRNFKIKRTFHLPIVIHNKYLQADMSNAKLIVQVVYDATELTGHFSEKLLTDEGSHDSMDAILDISILQATGCSA